jgi:hypothetical protein
VDKCLIWGTAAEEVPRQGDYRHLKSRRAGGEYKVAGTHLRDLESLTEPEKMRLTTWIVSQHRAGVAAPTINGAVLDDIKRRPPMLFSERVDRALTFIGTRTKMGGAIAVDVSSSQSQEALHDILAVTESADAGEIQSLLKMLEGEMGLVGPSQETLFYLRAKGWLRLDELQRKEVQSSQAFVAMWFNAATDEPYENGLSKAIRDSGYDPRRVDQQHHHLNKVDDEIIAEIRRSRFLVTDFTCEPKSVRGGVYFETSFAMGIGIPIIWTCKNTSMTDLHFDTRQYPHIEWKNSADLYAKLKARIGALIGDGPKIRAVPA